MGFTEFNPDRRRNISLTPEEAEGIQNVMRESLPKIYGVGSFAVDNFVQIAQKERQPNSNHNIDECEVDPVVDQKVSI